MSSIFAIGETIYDIIFKNDSPVAARAGGSMLNTAVSLGRAGCKVSMITELGEDQVGKLVQDFLQANGVSTEFVRPVKGFKTPVSLAFLDEQGNARYSFYKDYPDERLNISWPETGNGDIILFGSFYSLDDKIREKLVPFLANAKKSGALTLYDPNIRKNHLKDIRKMMDAVEENISLADIVRGSDEDFENLFGLTEGEEVYKMIQRIGGQNVIITKGREGACLYAKELRISVPSKMVHVLSTIGAGDAFNAGLIYGINCSGNSSTELVNINPDRWNSILQFGINFASDVCSSYDNYISADFAKNLDE